LFIYDDNYGNVIGNENNDGELDSFLDIVYEINCIVKTYNRKNDILLEILKDN
jgi:hypothetical protein